MVVLAVAGVVVLVLVGVLVAVVVHAARGSDPRTPIDSAAARADADRQARIDYQGIKQPTHLPPPGI